MGHRRSQLFTWRRLARLRTVGEPPPFIPAVLAAEPEERALARKPAAASRSRRHHPGGAASIELEVGGVVVRIGRDAEAGTIAAVIGALRAGS